MTPPELPRDVPVADVLEPVDVDAFPPFRKNSDGAFAQPFERRPGERLHLHEPLIGKSRLDDRVAAIAMPHGVLVLLGLYERAGVLQRLHDFLSRREAILAAHEIRNATRGI